MDCKNKQIPIFFTIDDVYAPYLSVALYSMMENASCENNYKVHIIHNGITRENQEKISNMKRENFEIVFVQMEDTLKLITDREENWLRYDYFTLTIYFRLFLADMFPEYDKGIYLDSDVVLCTDIAQMFNIELSDEQIIAGCPDFSVMHIPEITNYFEQSVGIKYMEYVNSGVLLMNMKLMRDKRLSDKFLSLLDKWHIDSVAPDQDYLNAMCHGRIRYLDESWDAMPKDDGSKELENPKLIHYNLFSKPWCYDVQYGNYFWKYAKDTVYYEELLEHRNNYSDEQKLNDKKAMQFLIEKAKSHPEKEITFKKLYEKGEDIRL